ncbi:MAG TPA: hypothetical protein PKN44_14750 [Bacteroidales bacterium]|nr:hypothetical protein [Bacteroidales bacterium]HPS51827.1 hypothetical protein [Bacteroidales bacterium]
MITDKFNEETGIAEAFLTGVITMPEILDWFSTLTPERFKVQEFKMLSDASEVDYQFGIDQLDYSYQAIGDLCRRFTRVRIAVVHSHARGTAYSEIVINKSDFPNYTQKIFSERATAMAWLMRGGDSDKL